MMFSCMEEFDNENAWTCTNYEESSTIKLKKIKLYDYVTQMNKITGSSLIQHCLKVNKGYYDSII